MKQHSRVRSEHGSILLLVAGGLLALMALSTFVFDYGVMWVARRQAQNAADAGALSGAVALAFDPGAHDVGALGLGTKAKQSAIVVASANRVWGQSPDNARNTVTVSFAVPCPLDTASECLRVDVFRDVAAGNPLPMFFGQLVGLTQQGVRAVALSQAVVADASDCLKPWAIPDKWLDHHDETPAIDVDTWTADDTYEKLFGNGLNKGNPLPDPDVYTKPGFKLADDMGREVVLKYGDAQQTIAPGNFFPVALPTWDGASKGASDYRKNIAQCNGIPVQIGDEVTTEPGNMIGPTRQGMEELIAQDPLATWDPITKTVKNSCAPDHCVPSAAVSPRIVAIPIFDTDYFDQGKQNGRTQIKVVNILGFFLDQMQGDDVRGYFTTIPGVKVGIGPQKVNPNAAFMKVPLLVR